MARRRKNKGLSEEDKAIWAEVAKTVNRSKPAPPKLQSDEDTPSVPAPKAPPMRVVPVAPMSRNVKPTPISHGPVISHQPVPSLEERFGNPAPRMDRKLFGKMRRGKLSPDARVDLHGMTVARAHTVLNGFIMRAYAEDLRLVLVITGKGRGNPRGAILPDYQPGILRHAVPDWLQSPPLVGMVLQITQAHQSHGGAGAYYVYLRKRR